MENNMKWSTDYTYDTNGRLTAAAEQDGSAEHYAYDAAGNPVYRGEGAQPVPAQTPPPPVAEQAVPPIPMQTPGPPPPAVQPTPVAPPPPPPAATPPSGGWICPVCGQVNTGKFCRKDGTPQPTGGVAAPTSAQGGGNNCPNCGNAVSVGAKFCKGCGTKM